MCGTNCTVLCSWYIYDVQAKGRMAQGGGDKKSGVENLPHPISATSKARDAAGKAVGVSGKTVDFATRVLAQSLSVKEQQNTARR